MNNNTFAKKQRLFPTKITLTGIISFLTSIKRKNEF